MASKELATTHWLIDAILKAYYRFESGALTTDSSGEGHTLTDISDPAEDASGKFGGAVAFDGNDAYSATDHDDLKPAGNFTFGCWIKTSTTGVAQGIFETYSQNTAVAGFLFRIGTTNKFQFLSGKNTGTTINTDYKELVGGTTITDGNWHFAVGTWDGSYLRVYIDGKIDASPLAWANAPVYAATNYIRIGCRNNIGTNVNFFTGSLDDLFLLNGVVLTADEIAGLYWGFKSINGLGMSSIKSINGLAKESVKSFNGI